MSNCWKSHVVAHSEELDMVEAFFSEPELFVRKIRAVEIPCPTCPTWSHFIQDKLIISIYLSLDKCKICYKVNKILYFIF